MPDGSIFKRCGCRHPMTHKPYGNDCPKLRRANGAWSSDHGGWAYQIELPRTAEGHRRILRRAGLPTRRAAADELDHARALLALTRGDRRRRTELADVLQDAVRARRPLPEIDRLRQRLRGDGPLAEAATVAEYLTDWLTHLKVDTNTRRGYESITRVHLIPHLGEVPLDKLRASHIRQMFTAIERRNAEIVTARTSPDPTARWAVRGIRTTGPSTRQRIRACLRKAINDALADELIVGSNPAALVKVPGTRPLPIVWEDERVRHWRTTGEVPGPIMVWTDTQVADFLDHAATLDPDLHPLWHYMAYRGPRRGEACGLRDSEVRLDRRETTINNQIATHGYTLVQKPPKSRAGTRDIALDDDTVKVLATYKARRAQWRLAAGPTWPDTGLFFVRPDGRPWHPTGVTQRFRRLIHKTGLPPIRLHDLRHSAATFALHAGVDIKVLSEQLGHSTTTLTRDTYQSVSKAMRHEAADAVAAMIRNRRRPTA
ncbi:tyrosine-type recombinase/integrase [Micromonospora yangpuensis]|uniref:Phage integrase, N-terminal SAM-like domain n=1 Tax=Micromonospora yangpuensis TaxID=683228 RepID=A0A1C6U3T7_9ACTN|nr:site-specific integrase [Micromonospora yangpuensis]GGL93187.1 site-specific integrase [Micromonospora yangpuensis]SCL48697.1 Phage integrase, N-terminal SAM-like domain [Micromonospora yangpuensis]